MLRENLPSARSLLLTSAFGFGAMLCLALPGRASAADFLNLPVVRPVMPCGQLTKANLDHITDTALAITSASVVQTPKGTYCKVMGTIAPATVFETDLPIEHWTQRFAEGAMGRGTIGNAGGCTPAINGEFAVAADNLGHVAKGQFDVSWTANLQERIDFAYRANHETALAAKALIRAFYGQPQRFAYFLGCSEGGREALQEAERFPADFDGISAGAPVAIDSVHNAFYHPWESTANTLMGNSRVLTDAQLPILHAAVIAHCASVSGVIDGMLEAPTACQFDPSWVQCAPGAADTSKCLTAAQTSVVAKLYEGPSDGAGNRFEITGFPLGSEKFWKLSTATQLGDREAKEGFALRRLLPPPEGNEDTAQLEKDFRFDQTWYNKLIVLAPLYDAANTDLAPFQAAGGKLILWQGAEDTTVQPAVTVAYYEGVQKQLGTQVTDSFVRYFLLPGVGHCGGGEGPAQVDLLTPLMGWVELHQAPNRIMVGKVQQREFGRGGFGSLLNAPGENQSYLPYALPNAPALYTRPVYPFPAVANYTGHGDPNDAANYEAVKSGLQVPQVFDTQASQLFGPDNQKFYSVVNNRELIASDR